MKKVSLVVLFAVLLVGVTFAQNTLPVDKVHGVKSLGQQRYGSSIWTNIQSSGWFSSMTSGYMWLDWGKLHDAGNMMPDEVVDGFMFSYATNATVGGLSWNMYYYDSCTGWGDYAVFQEAGFAFTGLPDATNLPPGYYWGWLLWYDLAGTGYEFLMGYDIGVGHSLITTGVTCGPRLTRPPNTGSNGNTGTEDAFDMYTDTGTYKGTYYFGGYPANPYASFIAELFGASDPSVGTVYGGVPLQGNNTGLYSVGNWAQGSFNTFLLRMNGTDHTQVKGGAFFNYQSKVTWWGGVGKTTVPNIQGGGTLYKIPFAQSYTGDYVVFSKALGSGAVNYTWYIQGAITNWLTGGSTLPVDASMDAIVS
jgi:hypothetical protein